MTKIYKDLKILSLDDDPMVRRMVEQCLLELGFDQSKLTFAVDGQDGLDKAKEAAAQNDPYEFIMTDMVMPNKSGLEFLEAIRPMAEYKKVPKLILSSQEEKVVIMQALQLGAHNYIVKPVQTKVLAQKIIKTFEKCFGA